MIVRYWQPLTEIETMRRQFDRVRNDLTTTDSAQTAWAPVIELKDVNDAFTLRVQLPGITAEDLDIQVSRNAVAIAGEHRQESEQSNNGTVRSEFRYGKFHRIVRLPAVVQNDHVQAEYKDGILNLTLPKVTEARNQVVKISLGKPDPAISSSELAAEAGE
ncbi:Hsp20/alpha crystallin family protein [Leptolyngbyaceae cyanobacterium UHCC 1019]